MVAGMLAVTATAQTVTPTVAPKKAATTKVASAPAKPAVKVVKPVKVTKADTTKKATKATK